MKNLGYYLFVAASRIIEVVPMGLTRAVVHAGAFAYYYSFPGKRSIIKRNMRRALGPAVSEREVRKTARRACRYYADYWVDVMRLPTLPRRYVLDHFETIGEDRLLKAIEDGRGALVVLPHLGSWEAGAVYLSSLGPFGAVAEVLKPKKLFDLFVKLRAGVGIEIFPYDHRRQTRNKMIEALGQGMMLALLCDRDMKGTGVEVEFFGERTTLPPGPAVMALKSGSPILCVSVRNLDGDRWVGRATEPIYVESGSARDARVQEVMQQVALRLEELIREDPAQWHMFMPAWPSDRDKRTGTSDQ